jgi:hypothetical protein
LTETPTTETPTPINFTSETGEATERVSKVSKESVEPGDEARAACEAMGVKIETFSAAHVKHLAIFIATIVDDPEVKGAINFVVTQDAENVKEQALPIIYAIVRTGFLKAADELDALLASLLDMKPEEFLKLDGEMYFHTITMLVDHPKFMSFLKSGQGMADVISSKWSTFFKATTDGPTSISNPSTSNGSTAK